MIQNIQDVCSWILLRYQGIHVIMCLDSIKIINSCDVEFLEHKSTFEHLEMCPSGSNGEFVDTPLISAKKEEDENNEDGDEGEEPKKVEKNVTKTSNKANEDIEDNDDEEYQPLNKKKQALLQKKEERVHGGESSLNERRYQMRRRRSLGEWWKNHIFL